MSYQDTIFRQILQLIPRYEFEKIVKSEKGNFASKGFTCWSQFSAMLFAQLSGQTGLRGIEHGIELQSKKLYHLGVSKIKRSTLSYANNNRPNEIYEKLFYTLLSTLHNKQKKHKFRFKNPLYSVDASTIDLCLNMFDWAHFRKKKGGIKLHVTLDHSSYIPSFITVTDAKVHESNEIKKVPFKKDDVIVFDRGYTDYQYYSNLSVKGIYFVTKLKKTTKKNLKIKTFLGTSRNAVLKKVWIVMISFLILKYL